jgi:predicted transcriptional regulator
LFCSTPVAELKYLARKKCKGTELSVFKGREAKLNRAVFQTLAQKGPQTIYDMHKEIKSKGLGTTRYANVNVRVRILQQSGYVRRKNEKKTRAGFQATIYELTAKALLAMLLDSIDIEKLIDQITEEKGQTIMGAILDSL